MQIDYTKKQKSNFVKPSQLKRKSKRSWQVETVDEYLARGKKIKNYGYSVSHYFQLPAKG